MYTETQLKEYARKQREICAKVAVVNLPSYSHIHRSKCVNTNEILNAPEPELSEQGGWVSVKDGLPDYDEYVLWHFGDGNMQVIKLDKDGNPWLGDWGPMPKVIHWTPLPVPPNESLNQTSPEGNK